jgi:superfamily II DNA or RNA helicase
MLSQDHEMGTLRENEETGVKQSWVKDSKTKLIAEKWPSSVCIVIADNIFIEKEGLSHRVLNILIRMAAFKNPEFYKAQALRLSTFGKPRIIHLAEEDEKNLILPRGCLEEVQDFFDNNEVTLIIQDKTTSGVPIHIHFTGKLNDAQEQAAIKLNNYQTGILSAIPAFGKTVIGTWLIAEKKVNTLILVHRQQLLDQWVERLKQFLSPVSIGTIGGGKFNPSQEIDVALLQSMTDDGDVRSLIKSYGMVIVDECHHISAFSFEKVIKAANAKFLYGITATPTRKDGHHPIISMRLGPIRHSVGLKQYAQTAPFQHIVSPKITMFTLPPKEEGYRIQDIYEKISLDESRNSQIIQDALQAWKDKRNVLILCDRIKHAELLKNRLEEEIGDLIFMSGRLKKKERQIIQTELTASIKQRPRFIIATGKYIGEGFDDPCLDTLFLTSPIAWYGTVYQYIGRLHRFHENKKEVRVYDYVDLHVPVLERMFYKRVKAYREAGYTVKPMDTKWVEIGYLFESDDYFETFVKDLLETRKQVLILSTHIDMARIKSLKQTFDYMREKQIKVTIITGEKPSFITDSLCSEGIDIEYNKQVAKQYAVIDQRIVWYGPLELLANQTKSSNVLRIEDSSLAKALLEFPFEKALSSKLDMTESNTLIW